MDPVANTSQASAERMRQHLGDAAAEAFLSDLAGLGLAVVEADELAELRRRADRYERLRNLVEGPDEPIR